MGELWQYRELLYFLTWRDLKIQYKQTAIGVAWVLIQPLAAVAIFTVFFGRLAHIPSDGVPYPLFAYVGLIPWSYFSTGVANAGTCLVANTNLISKVYFPRFLVVIASVLPTLVDVAIRVVVLLPMMLYFGITPRFEMLAIPVLILWTAITLLGVGAWLSSLDVQYRDVRHAISFLVQVWLFATPIVYPASLVPGRFQGFLGLNPMVGIVEAFRWAVFGAASAPAIVYLSSVAVTVVLVISGGLYFRRMERVFADVI